MPDGEQRLRVTERLGPAPEDDRGPDLGRGQRVHGDGGHGRGAQRGDRRAVDEDRWRQGVGVQEDVERLDAVEAAGRVARRDRDDFDAG